MKTLKSGFFLFVLFYLNVVISALCVKTVKLGGFFIFIWLCESFVPGKQHFYYKEGLDWNYLIAEGIQLQGGRGSACNQWASISVVHSSGDWKEQQKQENKIVANIYGGFTLCWALSIHFTYI